MKIFLASGYSVMNVKGREKHFRDRFHPRYRRLISFFDEKRGNNIYSTMGIKNEKNAKEEEES